MQSMYFGTSYWKKLEGFFPMNLILFLSVYTVHLGLVYSRILNINYIIDFLINNFLQFFNIIYELLCAFVDLTGFDWI